MFSALAEDCEFFRERVNLFVMLAPVARVDRCKNTTVRTASDNATFNKMLKKMGPEMMPEP